ncbi:MAG: dihydroorotate dehydrogenase [Christensenella sp.]
MSDMRVRIAGVELKNPIITASGTFGFAEEYAMHMDVAALGAFTLKALTREPRMGNSSVRIAEMSSGVLNSVGLQNPGVDEFLRVIWPRIKNIDTVKIANIAGACVEDYVYVAERLNDTSIDLFEINVSCPNVKEGGVNFGTDANILRGIVEKVKRAAKKPIIVKLTPNVTKIADMAKAAADGGADALSLINTITGMAIDAYTKRPVLANVTGGLSGPAIKAVALRMVWEVYKAQLGLPIIGMGGIMNGEDAAEFMIAGADAVMVGTATMRNPSASADIAFELEAYAKKMKIEQISELTGSLCVK